jgi:hypothetical protein
MDTGAYGRLVRLFRELGARDPEGWARAEATEGIPHLARYAFLWPLWRDAIDGWADVRWMDQWIARAERRPEAAFADAGAALSRLLQSGASRADISAVARVVGYETTFAILDRVDAGGDRDLSDEYPGWRLVEVGRDDKPTGRAVSGLHEELLMLDPSGREGRP